MTAPGAATSRPVYTSKADGFRTAEEIAAMRPITEPKPRAPRKAASPALRQVTNGIVCFCGERFGEHQALEFMLHLRAEVGDLADYRERRRRPGRVAAMSPERIETRRERDRRNRERERIRMAEDPAYRERVMERRRRDTARKRQRYATDPEYRAHELERDRVKRARKKERSRGVVSP